jgi:NADP-dependent 3-hydroxy acid dehydrogenase YdfG
MTRFCEALGHPNNSEEDISLSDKVILVSGANRGIGAATVRELLKADVKKIHAGG